MKHFITGNEFSKTELTELLDLASQIKANPKNYEEALKGKRLTLIFEKPSLRTRLSFNLAIQTLGGFCVESLSSTRKQEEPKDLIRVLNGYCDAVMIRTHDEKQFEEMIPHAKIPIINGLSANHHPCQILADLLTLKEKFGKLEGLTLTYIGVTNNILNSLEQLAPKLGIKIQSASPHNNDDPINAVKNADAVYTDVWTSMGFESEKNPEYYDYQVNEALMQHAKPTAIFLHCMPMVRGEEVSTTLPDSHQSAIFQQAENRLHAQKALLIMLLA